MASTAGSGARLTHIPPLPGGYGRSSLVVGPTAPRIVSGKGYEIIDEDGHRLVDLNNNFTALIHGHGHALILEAAHAAIEQGISHGAANGYELAHARMLLERLPNAEQVRYTNSGTEAIMIAIRVARATTGRDKIILIDGAYHGTCDTVLPASGARGLRGIPRGVSQDTLLVTLNDVASLRATIAAHADSLAAVLLDLVPNKAGLIPVTQEFADAASEEARRVGAFLVVDEVISFRHRYDGLQASYGLVPDITVLGKLIGGGFPVGAIAGPAEQLAVLDPFGDRPIEHGGTFTANPASMSAGRVSVKLFDEGEVERLNALGDLARTVLSGYAAAVGWEVRGIGSLVRPVPADGQDAAQAWALWWASYRRGVLITPSGLMALSTPMAADIVEHSMHRVGEALVEISESKEAS